MLRLFGALGMVAMHPPPTPTIPVRRLHRSFLLNVSQFLLELLFCLQRWIFMDKRTLCDIQIT